MPQIEIDEDLLVLQRQSKGNDYKSKLVSRLIDMVHIAKKLFGPRDLSYTIVNIEFMTDVPRIRYPENYHIIIRLTQSAATNMSRAYYQMAHETVHLLAPTGCNDSTNFEEGIACYFAADYMKEQFNEPCWSPGIPSYECALDAVTPLLDKDMCCVRRLREHHHLFQDITKEDIIKEFPDLESKDKDVDFLISKFDRGSGS